MSKKMWRTPEVRKIEAGSAEQAKPAGLRDGSNTKS